MNANHEPQDDPADLAALYLAGALDARERAAFEARLQNGDQQCLEALRDLEPGVAAIGAVDSPVQPPGVVRELLTRLVQSSAACPPPPIGSEHVFVRTADQGDWVSTASAGVLMRRLDFDPQSRVETLLLRMEPGAILQPHVHGEGGEECFMLQGDAFSAGYSLKAGDYQRLPAGQHGPVASRGGCLVLVRVSRP